MFEIIKEETQPNTVYVSGRYNGNLFEFNYYFQSGAFYFGTNPFVDGEYQNAEPLSQEDELAVKNLWISRYFISPWEVGPTIGP